MVGRCGDTEGEPVNQDLIALELPRVMAAARATGLDRSLCTFQIPDGSVTDNGFPGGSYVDVVGLVDLPCQVAPTSTLRVSAQTTKMLTEQEALNSSHVLLYGYYPDAEAAWRQGGRMVINGQIFENNDVLGVESDSQQTQTRAIVRVVTL